MKLTVLVDNSTTIDKYYLGEPALSYYIEDGDEKILFDCGYSDIVLRNAESIGVDLSCVTTIALSHGHDDHTGGLAHIRREIKSAKLVAHPAALFEKRYADGRNAGSTLRAKDFGEYTLSLSKHPQKISSHITFLGEIPRTNDFEVRRQFGFCSAGDGSCFVPDFVMDDSALVYEMEDSIAIITGCSHSGICNIVSYAKTLFKKPVTKIIGGFHLKEINEQVEKTILYLKTENISELYPAHCTSFAVKSAINQVIPVREVGVGLKIEW